MAEQSILTSVKRTLGLAEDYTFFDNEITMHINTALGTLIQLGLGDPEFELETEADTWDQFFGSGLPTSLQAKSYVYLRVQLLWDISTMPGPVISAKERQVKEAEWRVMIEADPALLNPPPNPDDEDFSDTGWVLDGGNA